MRSCFFRMACSAANTDANSDFTALGMAGLYPAGGSPPGLGRFFVPLPELAAGIVLAARAGERPPLDDRAVRVGELGRGVQGPVDLERHLVLGDLLPDLPDLRLLA